MNYSFSYGLEVEGVFKHSLLDKLGKFGLDCKSDSSVSVEVPSKWLENNDSADEEISEISVGVFDSLARVIRVLGMIDSDYDSGNYRYNHTCGLHFHIRPTGKDAELVRSLIEDEKLIKKLQAFGFDELCEHLKTREETGYCYAYENRYLRDDWRFQEKYRFMRNHPQGTYEFRFFSPCEHKAENIKRFMDFFLKELKKLSVDRRGEIALSKPIRSVSQEQSIRIKTKQKQGRRLAWEVSEATFENVEEYERMLSKTSSGRGGMSRTYRTLIQALEDDN